ncbi:MAG: preprotein translocase subunit SecG [Pseudomonadota bacterium]
METIVLVVHVLLAMTVIGLVLIQHGKGADAGAAFGSGASGTVFGARGSGSFLTRMTTAAVALFFVTSLVLFYFASQRPAELGSVIDDQVVVEEEQPAIPVDPVEEAAEPAADDVPTVE